MIQRETTRLPVVLLLEPNTAHAAYLASLLNAAGFRALISGNAGSALRVVEKTFFFALIVVADLTNEECLAMLAKLRDRAQRSWIIVAAPACDAATRNLIHRYGGDACVALPISVEDLIHRLDAFRMRARPAF